MWLNTHRSFSGGLVVKSPPAMQEMQIWSLAEENPLEKEMATHPSILAWEILWPEEPGMLQSRESQNCWTCCCCCCCCVTSVVSNSAGPHRRQPTRLPHPWDSPGKNTGVGCHFLLRWMKVKSESEVAQLCPYPSDPMDCSLPGSSIHRILLNMTWWINNSSKIHRTSNLPT